MENKVRKYAAMQLAEMQHKANPEDKQLAEAFEIAKAEYEKTQLEDAEVKAEPKDEDEAEPKDEDEAEPKVDTKATEGKKK
jgi:hypothetical protein